MVGTTSLRTGGVHYQVEKVIINSGYTGVFWFITNDVALVKIKGTGFKFSHLVQPIGLCERDLSGNIDVVISGWGKLNESDSKATRNLQFLNYKTINYFSCYMKQFPTPVPVDGTCALAMNKSSEICFGASGGPLVYRNKQIGIASYFKRCTVGYPEGYASVCYHNAWIKKTIDANE